MVRFNFICFAFSLHHAFTCDSVLPFVNKQDTNDAAPIFSSHSLPKIRWYEFYKSNQQVISIFCDGPPRPVRKFSRFFHSFGRSAVALNQTGPQAKAAIPKSVNNLSLAHGRVIINCLKYTRCFGPRSLCQNTFSQKYTVRSFQPLQKSTNRGQTFQNKKAWCDSIIPWTWPIIRRMHVVASSVCYYWKLELQWACLIRSISA